MNILRELWSLLLIVGLIGWLFSSIMLMLRAFPKKDVFVSSAAMKWGSVVLVSYFFWIIGMLNA